jgi:hypothetical protein
MTLLVSSIFLLSTVVFLLASILHYKAARNEQTLEIEILQSNYKLLTLYKDSLEAQVRDLAGLAKLHGWDSSGGM